MSRAPLSTPLSRLLIAFTIELDNEFERRSAEAGAAYRLASMVMWSNAMRSVGDGVAVGDLLAAAGVPKARLLSTLGGLERWGYVVVGPERESKRDGWGSGRAIRHDWDVRPTPAGRAAQEIWPPLFGEIERRWEERFGRGAIRELRASLEAVVAQLDVELPQGLPILVGTNGMAAEVTANPPDATGGSHLSALLAQVLVAYTLEFERACEVSLPLSANFLRVLAETDLDVRELPAAAGVSKEATSMALSFLTKSSYVAAAVGSKVVQLTARGREAEQAGRRVHAEIERAWERRFGSDTVGRLRAALGALLDEREALRQGLQPPVGGWRGTKRYVGQTKAVLADPVGRLPHYPMVLHRGGWPDGS